MKRNKRKNNKSGDSRGKLYRRYKRQAIKSYEKIRSVLESEYYESSCTLNDKRFLDRELNRIKVIRDETMLRIEREYRKR